ncbi:hypothetical protein FA13DRAFT_1729458 [Coprinellus micaceus]|uniref:Uncharacterized protein n=1 Tax=Coprinellus micaceus TaxID=71717 RepID=A0A4Y7TMN3_COPMI|nr:hypothetical protein FA13DRAFT_1729458 [Coprinellus micaceus]
MDSFDFRELVNLSFQVATEHGRPLSESICPPQVPKIHVVKLVGFLPQTASLPRTVTKLTIGPTERALRTSEIPPYNWGPPQACESCPEHSLRSS